MLIHLKHGPRIYRPLVPKDIWDWEVQFFRVTWGTKRPLDPGCGKCSFKMRVNPENWCVGLSRKSRSEVEQSHVLLHLLPLTFRVGFTRAYDINIRRKMNTV